MKHFLVLKNFKCFKAMRFTFFSLIPDETNMDSKHNQTWRGVLTRAVWSLDPLMMSPSLESRQLTSWLWPDNSVDMSLLLLWTRILPSLIQKGGVIFRTSLESLLTKISGHKSSLKKNISTCLLDDCSVWSMTEHCISIVVSFKWMKRSAHVGLNVALRGQIKGWFVAVG